MPKKTWQMLLLQPLFPVLFPHVTLCSSKFHKIISHLNPLFYIFHPNLVGWGYMNIGTFLDSIITNPELKVILLANLAYYHDDPYTLSLIYFSVAQAGYFTGSYFIKGGSQKLSDYLRKSIEEWGGIVLLGHMVCEIIVQDKKTIGLRYKKTAQLDSEPFTLYADAIISNASIPHTVGMLPKIARGALESKVFRQKVSCSLLSVYICFNKKLSSLGHSNYSTFYNSDVQTPSEYYNNMQAGYESRGFVFVDYGVVDSMLAPPGKSVGVICTIDYIHNWEHLSEEEYKKKKDQVFEVYLDRLEKEIPGIKHLVHSYEVATPRTIKKYTLNPDGSPYGFAQIPRQAGMFRMPVSAPVKNLYFASAWANPGGGFTGAMSSGWMAAHAVLSSKKRKNAKQSIHNDSTLYSCLSNRTSSRLVNKTLFNGDIVELEFSKPDNFTYQPGQYAVVELQDKKAGILDMPLRQLSMVSHPNEETLRFCMRISNTPYKQACKNLQSNDPVHIIGPYGDFALPKKGDYSQAPMHLVFLAGGIGITPIISILSELVNMHYQYPVLLLYTNKNKNSSLYVDWLQKLQLPQCTLVLNYTESSPRFNETSLSNHITEYDNKIYFIAGGSDFINDMKSLLQGKGVKSEHMYSDNFG